MGLISWMCFRVTRLLVDLLVVTVVGLLLITFLPGIPPHVSFTAFEPDPAYPLEGPLSKNNILDDAERVMDGHILGPESIASRNPNELFVSLHGGKILQIWGKKFDHIKIVTSIGPGCDGPWQEKICGRPLGLRFGVDGRLLVADAYLGLFALDVDTGEKELLFDLSEPIDGAVPMLADDLDVDHEGNIYWSDASTVSSLQDALIEFLSDPSGRLLKYDPVTKKNSVLVKDVHFANGVQMSPEKDFVLLSETVRNRVLRYWLKGPKTGTTEVFVDRLPGFPDNIRNRKDGGYYVSLVAARREEDAPIDRFIAQNPIVRKLILRIMGIFDLLFKSIHQVYPHQNTEKILYKINSLQGITSLRSSNTTIIVELDAEGNIVHSLQGHSGKLQYVSETQQIGDYLFFGSPISKYLGRLQINFPPEEDIGIEGKDAAEIIEQEKEEVLETDVEEGEPEGQKNAPEGDMDTQVKIELKETESVLENEKLEENVLKEKELLKEATEELETQDDERATEPQTGTEEDSDDSEIVADTMIKEEDTAEQQTIDEKEEDLIDQLETEEEKEDATEQQVVDVKEDDSDSTDQKKVEEEKEDATEQQAVDEMEGDSADQQEVEEKREDTIEQELVDETTPEAREEEIVAQVPQPVEDPEMRELKEDQMQEALKSDDEDVTEVPPKQEL